jgi:IS5 family transposase
MSQMSFSDAEYAGKRKRTRREQFLAEMEQVVPWKSLLGLIEPYYPVAGRGRQPYPLETMLRVHLLQNWYSLSDPGMEEELDENTPMRSFARLSLNGPIPDETTILNFRHLLEANELAVEVLRRVNAYLSRKGLMLKRGTIVDATFIDAPSSTKNAAGKRDPEMDSGCKGEQWHFGMKAHIGVDAESGLVHSVFTTPANESDVVQTGELLHGKEEVVLGDSGYLGAQAHVSGRKKKVRWEISRRPGTVHKLKALGETALVAHERRKASVRAKVEHPFRVIKCQFGLAKVRFKGLAKNTAHVITLFALSSLWMVRKRLLAMTGEVRAQ